MIVSVSMSPPDDPRTGPESTLVVIGRPRQRAAAMVAARAESRIRAEPSRRSVRVTASCALASVAGNGIVASMRCPVSDGEPPLTRTSDAASGSRAIGRGAGFAGDRGCDATATVTDIATAHTLNTLSATIRAGRRCA
jgi:hypothetical protein